MIKLQRLDFEKLRRRIKHPVTPYKTLIFESLRLLCCKDYYDFNKIQASKFKKSLFYLKKKEKIVLIRSTINKTCFS